jgi:micrococcal nuclease
MKRYWFNWIAICSLICGLILTGCQPAVISQGETQGETVQVSRVVSGQTLEVIHPDASTALTDRVRLIGVAAPNWNQAPWGKQAQQQLDALIGDDPVLLESDVVPDWSNDDGSEKIRLAYVWRGDTLLNEKLVELGYALAASRSPNINYEQRLAYAQEKARLLGRGIWDPANPMRQTPQEFRSSRMKAEQ